MMCSTKLSLPIDTETSEDDRPAIRLTNCEKTILRLMIEGRSPREMADLLCVSRRTVEYHQGHIYAKLDANNRMEAIQQAFRQGLFQPAEMVTKATKNRREHSDETTA